MGVELYKKSQSGSRRMRKLKTYLACCVQRNSILMFKSNKMVSHFKIINSGYTEMSILKRKGMTRKLTL